MEKKENFLSKQSELELIRERKIKGVITRTIARWAGQAEKNSKYFCSLEKRHYTEKTIPKLVLHDNKEIYDQHQILMETKQINKPNYDCKKFETFINGTEQLVSKLNEQEKEQCEGKITLREATQTLKNIKNGKSPGGDGFTVEFLKFFWIDIGHFLVRGINSN